MTVLERPRYQQQRSIRLDTTHAAAEAPPARPARPGYLAWKALTDYVVALALLVLTAPLVLVLAVLVKLTSRGPAFYAQRRLGHRGVAFTLLKLRTMAHDCERLTGPCWATSDDPRVTPLGRFLRATHLDELPQLWNVLKGEMSLIGPRPERPEIARELARVLPQYRGRLAVRPGLTGLAQVHLPPDTDLGSVRRKLGYDLRYVSEVGAALDLRIALATLGCACRRIADTCRWAVRGRPADLAELLDA